MQHLATATSHIVGDNGGDVGVSAKGLLLGREVGKDFIRFEGSFRYVWAWDYSFPNRGGVVPWVPGWPDGWVSPPFVSIPPAGRGIPQGIPWYSRGSISAYVPSARCDQEQYGKCDQGEHSVVVLPHVLAPAPRPWYGPSHLLIVVTFPASTHWGQGGAEEREEPE